ncbi:MAG: FAD-binding oxidoreductase [bacterium]
MISIIGGGIIGASIAYYLGQAGIKNVVLYEKERLLGTGTTQYCSGGVRYQFTTPINVRFSSISFTELEKFDIGLKHCGYLILDMETDSGPRVKMQNELGVASRYLTPAEIKGRFPYINTKGVKSGSFHDLDGIAEPAKLLELYEKRAKSNGVEFRMGSKVKRLVKDGGRVTGFETDEGFIPSDTVILAAGPQSKELGKTIGIDIPIVRRRKYVAVISGLDFDYPVTMEIPTGWYIKKEGKDALVGMSGKDERIDFELQQESVNETIEASIKRFPQTENSSVKKIMSTMSDETPDKHAVIDDHMPGLVIATGFSGHGFMHSPAVGKTVASLVKQEKPKLDISELRLYRSHIKEPIAI